MSKAGPAAAVHDPADRKAILTGVVLILAAVAMLPIMDGLMKFLTGSMSAVQIAFLRFLAQTIVSLPVVLIMLGPRGLSAGQPLVHAARGACHAGAAVFIVAAFRVMPLADAMAIFFVMPVIVTILSALFLREQVGIRRWLAVVVGFIGALIVIRPGGEVFSAASLLPLGAAASFGTYVILTRRFVSSGHPLTLNYLPAAWASVILLVLLVIGHLAGFDVARITMPDGEALSMFAAIGVISMLGHLLFVMALARAPASIAAPLTYFEIPVAALVGYLMFGDIPDVYTWIGIVVITGSGVYISYREQIRRRAAVPSSLRDPPPG